MSPASEFFDQILTAFPSRSAMALHEQCNKLFSLFLLKSDLMTCLRQLSVNELMDLLTHLRECSFYSMRVMSLGLFWENKPSYRRQHNLQFSSAFVCTFCFCLLFVDTLTKSTVD